MRYTIRDTHTHNFFFQKNQLMIVTVKVIHWGKKESELSNGLVIYFIQNSVSNCR